MGMVVANRRRRKFRSEVSGNQSGKTDTRMRKRHVFIHTGCFEREWWENLWLKWNNNIVIIQRKYEVYGNEVRDLIVSFAARLVKNWIFFVVFKFIILWSQSWTKNIFEPLHFLFVFFWLPAVDNHVNVYRNFCNVHWSFMSKHRLPLLRCEII